MLIIGGSLGSVFVNNAVRSILDDILENYNVIHLCGKGNLDKTLSDKKGYVQYEYISKELKDLFALADIVISRAGANAICELLALKKPNILIPLSAAASRGDQILNARSFKNQGFSIMIEEEDLTPELLKSSIIRLSEERESFISAMEKSELINAIDTITKLIEKTVRSR